jgi:VWFA-related protein
LRPDEFELSEDGKRQQIVSASLVHGGAVRALEGVPTAAPGAQASVTPSTAGAIAASPMVPDGTPSVTAILFDRLSPEIRPLAHRAALTYLGTLSPTHDYAGIFLADVKLVTFAGFTNERETLRAAVDRLGASAPTSVSPAAERAGYSRVQQIPVDPNQPVTPGAESGAGWMTALEREKFLKEPDPEGMLRRIELRMFETYQQFLSEFQGQASLAGLRSVVESMSALPGRKSILYFTESLPITDRLKPKFDALIGEANRGNITVYPVDAAGLRVHSEEARVGRNVGVAGSQGVGDADRGKGAWTKGSSESELLSSRPTAVLGRLAKDAGGFLLENTNDPAPASPAFSRSARPITCSRTSPRIRRWMKVRARERESEASANDGESQTGLRRCGLVTSEHS